MSNCQAAYNTLHLDVANKGSVVLLADRIGRKLRRPDPVEAEGKRNFATILSCVELLDSFPVFIHEALRFAAQTSANSLQEATRKEQQHAQSYSRWTDPGPRQGSLSSKRVVASSTSFSPDSEGTRSSSQ